MVVKEIDERITIWRFSAIWKAFTTQAGERREITIGKKCKAYNYIGLPLDRMEGERNYLTLNMTTRVHFMMYFKVSLTENSREQNFIMKGIGNTE